MSFGIPVRNGVMLGLTASTALTTRGGFPVPALSLNFLSGTLDSRITFTRALNTATRVNSSGLIETVNANIPRFDYDPVTLQPRGLLIEEARTNLFIRSQEFDVSATWVPVGASVTPNATVSPDGTATADKLIENASTGVHTIYQVYSQTINTPYTMSFYAKAAERTWVRTRGEIGQNNFNLANGTLGTLDAGVTATITPAGNGWYRCTATKTATSTGSANSQIAPSTGNGVDSYTGTAGSGVFIYGAQLEAGSFATSYIPTTTTSLTRNADVAAMTGTNFSSWYNAARGSFIIGFTSIGFASNAMIFSVTDGTLTNLIQAYWPNATTITMDGGVSATMSLTAAQNTASTLAYAYALNNYAATINGAPVTTDTSGTPPPTMSQLNIGNRNGALVGSTHLRRIVYYSARLSDTAIRTLTA